MHKLHNLHYGPEYKNKIVQKGQTQQQLVRTEFQARASANKIDSVSVWWMSRYRAYIILGTFREEILGGRKKTDEKTKEFIIIFRLGGKTKFSDLKNALQDLGEQVKVFSCLLVLQQSSLLFFFPRTSIIKRKATATVQGCSGSNKKRQTEKKRRQTRSARFIHFHPILS